MILTKLFQTKITPGSVLVMSENLKQIVENDTLSDTDIVLVTSVVEKLTNSLTVAQRNENQVRFCLDFFLEVPDYLYLFK